MKYKYPINIRPIRIVSSYGERMHPIEKVKKFHNGIDISCPVGTPIYASLDGKVVKVDHIGDDKDGISLVVDYGNFISGFGHLSKTDLKLNERFKKGDIIAYSGNSGKSQGAHIHFTYRNAKWEIENPELYFEA